MRQLPSLLATTEPANDLLWPVLVAAALTTVLCVLLHYLSITWLVGRVLLRRVGFHWAVAVVVLAMLAVHMVEIGLFATSHGLLMHLFGNRVGGLVGNFDGDLTDLFYYSTAVYTTVGFGDITPEGPLRILTGIEALAGLMLVTWSASFTFLAMQEDLRRTRSHGPGRGEPG